MSLQDNTLSEEYAENIRCPDCGYDIQPDDTYREVAESIGEIYLHPCCPNCNVYNSAYNIRNTDWWVGE